MHNVRISEWIEMVLFDMKCLAVLHSQFKDALCLLKIVIILYEHKCTWERSIQQITNVTQKIDQLIDWNSNELINWTERQRRCLCRATSLTVNKRLKSVLAVFFILGFYLIYFLGFNLWIFLHHLIGIESKDGWYLKKKSQHAWLCQKNVLIGSLLLYCVIF